MLARARRQPPWRFLVAYCAALVIVVGVGEGLDASVPAGVLALALLAVSAAVLYTRPDGEGMAIFGAIVVVGIPLALVDWSRGVELGLYVAGLLTFAALAFDPRPNSADAKVS